jgi:hypothetical protein
MDDVTQVKQTLTDVLCLDTAGILLYSDNLYRNLYVIPSVATVMTNVFQKNGIIVSRKLAKFVRIFVDMGHIKS